MLRTQISLSAEQHAYLKELSRQTGASLSELVRRAIDELREKNVTPVRKALELVGSFEADRDDVSERHDDFFPEAL